MVRIIFYIIIALFILLIVRLLFIVAYNIHLNIRMKRRQTTNNTKVFNTNYLKTLMRVLIISILAISFTVYRNVIYTTLYIPGPIMGDCIDLGDDTYTDESQLDFFNYKAIITIKNHEETISFDILKENGFPIPYKTSVYTYQEVERSSEQHNTDFLFNKYHLKQNNIFGIDVCDTELDLQSDKTYFILGRYVDENLELGSYENGIYVHKAVELNGYDIDNPVDEQDQDIIDLLEALGYFVDISN